MTAHSILRDSTLEPNLIQLITSTINGHSSSVIVDAREDKADFLIISKTSIDNTVFKFLVVINRAYVHVVAFDINIWVDIL